MSKQYNPKINNIFHFQNSLCPNKSHSSSLCLFHVIWQAGENILHFNQFQEPESWNLFSSTSS